MGKRRCLNPPCNITIYTPRSQAGLETNSWFDNIVLVGGVGGGRGGRRDVFACDENENLGISDSSAKYTLPAERLGVPRGCVVG